LEILTPPWLSFKVLSKSTPEIESGTILKYQLKLHGVPINWETHISQWQPAQKFVDVQAKGPYALWHHTHSFQDHAGGTLMTDHVRLRLPLGKLGFLVASPMVLKDVERIFNFRKQKIAEIFGATPPIKLVGDPTKRS
jgi:ligand-binding SRPBCC domain-containing protein